MFAEIGKNFFSKVQLAVLEGEAKNFDDHVNAIVIASACILTYVAMIFGPVVQIAIAPVAYALKTFAQICVDNTQAKQHINPPILTEFLEWAAEELALLLWVMARGGMHLIVHVEREDRSHFTNHAAERDSAQKTADDIARLCVAKWPDEAIEKCRLAGRNREPVALNAYLIVTAN